LKPSLVTITIEREHLETKVDYKSAADTLLCFFSWSIYSQSSFPLRRLS